ncbi:ABC transporter ATP-binding protein [Shewanella sp. UCD-KL12]|uniref:ABC transporter ATP-binding protein n=1 Tax=Shewanella sp. UCD-KL12 TaxID=1917163 RepID=UPI0009711AAF|nr:ABC transporter ATP-binding protein [Shewanella sp. UCD-KL12]
MNKGLAVTGRNIRHEFGHFLALDDVSFDLPQGQTMALLGHNGAGKSTLIKILLGLITPMGGEIDILGRKVTQQSARADLRIGYLPENVSFYDKLTGEEILTYFAELKGVSASKVSELIEEFGLEYAKGRQLKTYSKGMAQRLGFAQAILSEPELLLLDEPTVGLDPAASQFLYAKIDELKQQGTAVIVCTHELSLIENNIDHALILARGKSLASGGMDSLRQQSQLKIKITSPALKQAVSQSARLQSLCIDEALYIDREHKAEILQYLTSQHSVFDLSIFEPGLAEIYRYYNDQACDR